MAATCVAFSPTALLLAAGSIDTTIALWSVLRPARTREKPRAVARRHQAPVYAVAFSPDGKLLISGSRDGEIRYWDMTDSGGSSQALGK